jgi:hypothetical protein
VPTTRDQEEQDIRIDQMTINIEKIRSDLRWEPWKALAAILAAATVMLGAIIGLANWWHPSQPTPLNVVVHLDAPLVVPGPPAK